MNKLISIIIVLCFVLGGLGAAAIQPTDHSEYKLLQKTLHQSINDLTITEKDKQYIRVSFSENDQWLLSPGKPILPEYTQIFELPFGSTNIDVQITTSGAIQQTITKQIQPSSAALPLSPIESYNAPPQKDEQLYQSNDPYPSTRYQFNVGVGVNDHFEHITYVTVHWYPIQYIPAQNIITVAETADITVTYTTVQNQHRFPKQLPMIWLSSPPLLFQMHSNLRFRSNLKRSNTLRVS